MPAPTATEIAAAIETVRTEMHSRMDTIEKSLAALATARPAAPSIATGSASETLPNYGRAKGQPIRGAQLSDLEYYAAGCRRSLDDPGKSRWHATERERLAAIEAEIARQTGGSADTSRASDGGGGFVDDEVPFAKMSDRVQ